MYLGQHHFKKCTEEFASSFPNPLREATADLRVLALDVFISA